MYDCREVKPGSYSLFSKCIRPIIEPISSSLWYAELVFSCGAGVGWGAGFVATIPGSRLMGSDTLCNASLEKIKEREEI